MQALVVKLGGAAVDSPATAQDLWRQIAALRLSGVPVVVVHGGGARVTALAARLGHASRFVGGRRVTDDGALEAAKLALAGGVATDLAAVARQCGVPAVAFSAVSAGLLDVRRRPVKDGIDFGWVGDVVAVNAAVLTTLTDAGFVPLVASLGSDADGAVYNVNADTVACAIAAALPGSRLVVLTETDGVLRDPRMAASRIPRLGRDELDTVAASGGMLPKLQSIAGCLAAGVSAVHVASWRTGGVLAACLSGDLGVGTVIS